MAWGAGAPWLQASIGGSVAEGAASSVRGADIEAWRISLIRGVGTGD